MHGQPVAGGRHTLRRCALPAAQLEQLLCGRRRRAGAVPGLVGVPCRWAVGARAFLGACQHSPAHLDGHICLL